MVSLVTEDQQRAVRRMQHDLDLRAPIETPRLDTLQDGGHRIGDPASERSRRKANSGPPTPRSKSRPRHAVDGGQSVYVANLPFGATAEDIQGLFGRYGEVHQATIITDRRTGRSKGFGFVDMPRPAARSAVEGLHGSKLDGRDLTVSFARPRRSRR